MSSIKRIYLACRAAIAELGVLNYFISTGILIGMAFFGLVVNKDANSGGSVIRQEYTFWDPDALSSLIVAAGWIAGLIVSGTLYNRWYKEENQAVRMFSLPLSNGERFGTMLLLYLVYVPFVCLIAPLLLTMASFPLMSDFVMSPAPVYLWKVLVVGWVAHAVTCILWLFPSIAFGKKVAFVLIGMIGLIIFYINLTHGDISNVLGLPYTPTSVLDQNVVGLSDQSYQLWGQQPAEVNIQYLASENLLVIAQVILASIMLAAAGIALTRKTA